MNNNNSNVSLIRSKAFETTVTATINEKDKAKINKAARISGMTLSAFIRTALIPICDDVISGKKTMKGVITDVDSVS